MKPRPFCVGLTGGIGSGKTAVSGQFAQLGADVVDTDLLSKALTGPGGRAMPALVAAFGQDVAGPDGALDRPAMRQRVFSRPEERTRLESILHPMIRDEAARLVAASTAPYVLLVVPLLLETGAYGDLVDRILVVDCPEPVQYKRVMARDGLSDGQVKAILGAQVSRHTRLSAADDVIVNDESMQALAQKVSTLHDLYMEMASGWTP